MKSKGFDTVLIFPPQWLPLNPPFIIVPTYSTLEKNGYATKVLDLNLAFYRDILQRDYLKLMLNKALSDFQKLFDYLSKNFVKGKKEEEYSEEFRIKLQKYNKIKEFNTTKYHIALDGIERVQGSLSVLKDKTLFYDAQKLTNALNNIDFCLEIASLTYFPSTIRLKDYTNNFAKLDGESLLLDVLNEKSNIFLAYYKRILWEIKEQKPENIVISIHDNSQLLAGVTLCHFIKKENFTKVYLAGPYWEKVKDELLKHQKFCEIFTEHTMDIKAEETREITEKDLGHFKKDLYFMPEVLLTQDDIKEEFRDDIPKYREIALLYKKNGAL